MLAPLSEGKPLSSCSFHNAIMFAPEICPRSSSFYFPLSLLIEGPFIITVGGLNYECERGQPNRAKWYRGGNASAMGLRTCLTFSPALRH